MRGGTLGGWSISHCGPCELGWGLGLVWWLLGGCCWWRRKECLEPFGSAYLRVGRWGRSHTRFEAIEALEQRRHGTREEVHVHGGTGVALHPPYNEEGADE